MKTLILTIAVAAGLMLAAGGLARDEHSASRSSFQTGHGIPAAQAASDTSRTAEGRARDEAHTPRGSMPMMEGMGMMHGMMEMMGSMMNMMSRMMGGGMMSGGTMDGCPMMGGSRPNEQWRR